MFSRVQILHPQPLLMPKTTFSMFKTPPEINLKHLEPLNAEPTKTKRGCLPCQKDITYREMNKQEKDDVAAKEDSK